MKLAPERLQPSTCPTHVYNVVRAKEMTAAPCHSTTKAQAKVWSRQILLVCGGLASGCRVPDIFPRDSSSGPPLAQHTPNCTRPPFTPQGCCLARQEVLLALLGPCAWRMLFLAGARTFREVSCKNCQLLQAQPCKVSAGKPLTYMPSAAESFRFKA